MIAKRHISWAITSAKYLIVFILPFLFTLSCHQRALAGKAAGPLAESAFFGSDRFNYFQDSLVVRFMLERREDINSFTGTLLTIESNSRNHTNLFIDWRQQSGETHLYLAHKNHINRFAIADSLLFRSGEKTPVSILLDFHRDLATVTIGGHTVTMFGMELSVQNGYKFDLLPVLSSQLMPNMKPVLQVSGLTLSYDNRGFVLSTYWYVLIILADLLVFLWMHLRRRRLKKLLDSRHSALQSSSDSGDNLFTIDIAKRSAVFLFGGFQVFDREGCDITKKFSPLLKELFCLILTHSAKKGISSDKLNELLWFDKDRVSAKNNRAVNIGKLRSLLDQVGQYDLSNDTGYWKFESAEIYVDYVEYTKLRSGISSPPKKEEIEVLAAIVRNGNLLPESDYRWTDSFKAHISDQSVHALWRYALSLNPDKYPEQVLQLSDLIFGLEPINEQALYLKCRSYYAKGRHSSAKGEYDRFCEEYEAIYGEKFPFSFTELLEKTDWE